ncbi:MAG TPA: glycosyltransferase family 4 protein [Acidimicrobiales bacterium]
MRVAIVAPPWVAVPPSAYGGIEIMLDTLARGLDAAGHDVTLFTTGDSTCPVKKAWLFEAARGIATAGPSVELRHVMSAYDVARQFDIFHDHTLTGPVYADRFPWLPVVTTNHGPFLSELGPIYQAISNRVPVIAISHHQASTAQGVNLAGVIHHGVDLAGWPVGMGGGDYAVFLGRMNPDKGVHHAARAARSAGMPLKIAAKMSEPAEMAYFNDSVKPLLGGDIEYIGEVNRTEKLQLLGEATCLLNPIDWPEPFGVVMIEALATGTPVIAAHVGSAPEIVDDGVTGILAHDQSDLVEALQRVAELDRFACRKAAEDRFSAERMVAEHVAVYAQVCEERRRATRHR